MWNVLLAGRYRLDELVGRGGMGEVWCAEDEVLRRPVAVKLLLPQRADDTAIERFRREARAAAVLSHPNVVAVYDFGTHEDRLFLVMELVEGRTLTEELAVRGTLPAAEAADIIAQAAAGLAVAHDHGLVHRDIKPGNLLLTADGTVKVADFGIARFVSDAATDLTSTGQIVGTTYYLAPERAKGVAAGPESDVYSLGCVLYQLVTGHPPFDADTPAAVLYQHVDLPPVPPAELRPELAGPFQDSLLRMLAKDPADRPTAAQLATWSLDDAPAWSRPAAVVPAAAAAAADADAEPPTPVITTPVDKSRRRMIQTVVAAAGAAVVSTAVVVALALDSDPDKAPPTTEPPAGTTPSVTRSGGPASNPTAGPSSGNPSQAGEQTRQVLSTQIIIGQQSTAPNPTGPNPTAPNPTGPNSTAPDPTGAGSTGPTVPAPDTAPTSKPGQPRDTPAPTQPSQSTPGTSSTQPTTSGPSTNRPENTKTPKPTKTKPPKPDGADGPT